MLVRLLLAVLTVTGSTPVRVCTCAAAATPCQSPTPSAPQPAGHQSATETAGCKCRAKAVTRAWATTDEVGTRPAARAEGAAGHSHPDRHDRDCPAVSPRPPVSAAALTPTAAVSPEVDPGVPVEFVPAGVGSTRATTGPEPRTVVTVPRYISLLTLRI